MSNMDGANTHQAELSQCMIDNDIVSKVFELVPPSDIHKFITLILPEYNRNYVNDTFQEVASRRVENCRCI